MIPSIFEILGLLVVSASIGLIFSWIFWRKKYAQLEINIFIAKKSLADMEKTLNAVVSESEKLKDELKKQKETSHDITALKQAKAKEKDMEGRIMKFEEDMKDLKQADLELKDINEMLKEELDAKERELISVSTELEKGKISYYKQIEGKRYKAVTLKLADESIVGKGDGRISMEDAIKIFDTISDGKTYTQVEKETLKYLRDHYNWTENADELFRKKVRSWAAKGHELN